MPRSLPIHPQAARQGDRSLAIRVDWQGAARNGKNVNYDFEDVQIRELAGLDAERLDDMPFGVIGLSADALVTVYNATESKNAGLRAQRVVG